MVVGTSVTCGSVGIWLVICVISVAIFTVFALACLQPQAVMSEVQSGLSVMMVYRSSSW